MRGKYCDYPIWRTGPGPAGIRRLACPSATDIGLYPGISPTGAGAVGSGQHWPGHQRRARHHGTDSGSTLALTQNIPVTRRRSRSTPITSKTWRKPGSGTAPASMRPAAAQHQVISMANCTRLPDHAVTLLLSIRRTASSFGLTSNQKHRAGNIPCARTTAKVSPMRGLDGTRRHLHHLAGVFPDRAGRRDRAAAGRIRQTGARRRISENRCRRSAGRSRSRI